MRSVLNSDLRQRTRVRAAADACAQQVADLKGYFVAEEWKATCWWHNAAEVCLQPGRKTRVNEAIA